MANSNIVCCGLNNFDKRFGDMSCTSVHPWNLDENVDGVQCNADFVKMPENKWEMVPNDDGICNISNCKTKKKKTTFVLDKTSLIYSVQSFHVTMTLKDVFKVMKTDVHFLTTLVVLKNLNIEFLQFLANSVKKYAGACVTFNEIKMPENKQELDDDVDNFNSKCKNKKKSTTFIFDEASLLPSFPVTMSLADTFKMIQTNVRFMTTLVALKNLTIEFLQFLANSVNQCAGAYITFNEVTNNAFCNKQIVVSSFGRVGRSKKNLFKEMSHQDKRLSTDTKELTSAVKDFLGGLEKKLDEHGSLLKDHGGLLKDHGGLLKDHGGLLKDHGGLLKDYANKLDEHANLLKDYKTTGLELLSRLLDLSGGKDNANVLCSLEPTRPVSSLADRVVKDNEEKENASPTHLSSTSPTEPMQLGSRASSEMDPIKRVNYVETQKE